MELASLERRCSGRSRSARPSLELVARQGATDSVALLPRVSRAAQGRENSRTVCSDLPRGRLLPVSPAQICKGRFTWAGDNARLQFKQFGTSPLSHGGCSSIQVKLPVLLTPELQRMKRGRQWRDREASGPSPACAHAFYLGKAARLSVPLGRQEPDSVARAVLASSSGSAEGLSAQYDSGDAG